MDSPTLKPMLLTITRSAAMTTVPGPVNVKRAVAAMQQSVAIKHQRFFSARMSAAREKAGIRMRQRMLDAATTAVHKKVAQSALPQMTLTK